jgi:hypothetical protein
LKSGNLAGAQSAFATFQSDLQTRSDAGVGNSQLSQNSQIADDIASLKNALDSSDVTTAQQAFMTLKHEQETSCQRCADRPFAERSVHI